jgi:hypothetical protein
VTLREMRVSAARAGAQVDLAFETEAGREGAYFRSVDAQLRPHPEAGLAAALLPCMADARELVVEAPVSARLLQALPRSDDV